MTGWAVVEAPSGLGLRATGVELLPRAMRDAGLLDALDARVATTLEVPARTLVRDAATGVLHGPEIARFAVALSGAVGDVLDSGRVPLVLGGDCSILLGNALALRQRGRSGLLFLDGHSDFYQPAAEPSGEAASMDLALVTGYGPTLLASPDDAQVPLIRAEDAVPFGFRDSDESERDGSQPLPGSMRALDLAAVRLRGAERAAHDAIAHLLRRGGPERFWVHLDADVLDDASMPAVDYRLPGGLQPDELSAVLRTAMATGRVAGVEVTIYNPTLDVEGAAGRTLAETLTNGLQG